MFILLHPSLVGFPGGTSKEPTCQCRRRKRCGFDPWIGKIPWRRAWRSTPVFLPGESHVYGRYSIRLQRVGPNWSDLTHTHTHTSIITYGLHHGTKFQLLQMFRQSDSSSPIIAFQRGLQKQAFRNKTCRTWEVRRTELEKGMWEGSRQNTEASWKRPKFRIHPHVCRS